MGVNKLNSWMKEMTETARISVKTNHSGRKTLVQKLQDKRGVKEEGAGAGVSYGRITDIIKKK